MVFHHCRAELIEVFGINDHGDIVGAFESPSGLLHAFRWNNGVMFDLTPGSAVHSIAFDINNARQIVGQLGDGTSTINNGQQIAFLWENEILNQIGLSRSSVFSINEHGFFIVNENHGSGGPIVRGINNLGDYVGWASGYATLNGDPLPSSLGLGFAYAVNDRREIVGFTYANTHNPVPLPTLWLNGDDHILSEREGRAIAINNHGHIVGESEGRAFVYTLADHNFRYLDDVVDGLSIPLISARAINDSGEIATFGSDRVSYLLTPNDAGSMGFSISGTINTDSLTPPLVVPEINELIAFLFGITFCWYIHCRN